MSGIHFFSEGINFKLLNPRITSAWVKSTIALEGKRLKSLNFIFCSDAFLRKINIEYLKHRTLTDIITFNEGDDPDFIEGEIFISIPRVKENAAIYKVQFDTELSRVLIHGVLHLLGYGDKTSAEKVIMRKKEDAFLSLRYSDRVRYCST